MGSAYEESIRLWRQKKDDELHGDSGWLALAGLFWLSDGTNTVGTDPACAIGLPDGSAPLQAGVIDFRDGVATLRMSSDASAMVDGQPVSTVTLRSDKGGSPSVVWIGQLRFIIIERRGRYAVRLWDHRRDTHDGFAGRRWYPVDEAYRVADTLVPFDPPRTFDIASVVGDVEPTPSPGEVVFTLLGQEHRLVALGKPGALRFYLRDRTSGDTTYPACRYLEADTAPDGSIVVDFNKAYSPPCAFTNFATCPLPPPENHLPVRIEAGELYENAHH